MKISLIVALDKNQGFSREGVIPWINEVFAKEDLKRFRKLTMNNTCIMGRLTFEDIKLFTKTDNILPKRDCMVLSRDTNLISNTPVFNNMTEALKHADKDKECFIIGGYSLFEEAFKHDLSTIYITRIKSDYSCDKFFPSDLMKDFKLVEIVESLYQRVEYQVWKKKD